MDIFRAAISALAIVTAAMPASAMQFTMDFDGIPPANVSGEATGISAVRGFYNGDPRTGSKNWDVTFNDSSLAIRSEAAGGPGGFPTAHSGTSAVGSIGEPVRLRLSTGVLLTGLSLYFDRIVQTSAPILDFLLDGEIVFSETLSGCASTLGDGYCGWAKYDLQTSLANKEVNGIGFFAETGTAVFDDITLSTTRSSQPIPEPGSLALGLLGLLGLAMVSGLARRRVR